MEAKKCDICGHFFEPAEGIRLTIKDNISLNEKELDVCPFCKDDLELYSKLRKSISEGRVVNINAIEKIRAIAKSTID